MPLLLLIGASGVGKTSIAKLLCNDWGFMVLPNFTTRILRDGESDRFHISDQRLDDVLRNGDAAFVNEVFGMRYGVLKSDLELALSDGEYYLFDIDRRHLHKLEERADHIVFILPESERQVIQQLTKEKRNDRIAQSIFEQKEILRFIADEDYHEAVVINRPNKQKKTAETIASICGLNTKNSSR